MSGAAADDVPSEALGEVVSFWREVGEDGWFKRSDALDAAIARRFGALHRAAARGRAPFDAGDPGQTLGMLILLDQFSRNLHRGSSLAFANDARAREIASAAIAAGHDRAVEPALRTFFYLPFMHSESLADQDRSVALYAPLGGSSLRFADLHRDVVVRFGRFPHRNAALGRETTEEEARFLAEGGFSG